MRKPARIIGIIALALGGLLCTQFAWLAPAKTATDSQRFAQKVNLALRRTVHHLLLKSGDSTSRIQPVKQLNAQAFSIRIDHSLDYSQLPGLLQESFKLHDIKATYDVAVLDCAHGELQLGYTFRDLTDTSGVPCVGRNQIPGCYNLQVNFSTTQESSPPMAMGWSLTIGVLLAGLGYITWRKWTPANGLINAPDTDPETPGLIQFGESSFDSTTQTLRSGPNRHNLTYREAKLLRFFVQHSNQIVDRDFILKSVWEDEGIIVGRSVDVFVSRLRKLLQDDPTVRIVAIHGIGYRLEIQA